MPQTFEQRRDLYARLWEGCKVRPESRKVMEYSAQLVSAGRNRYKAISAATGVPWWFIGFLHLRESNCNFGKHLHNGDDLAGKTRQVPPGRPPWRPRNGIRYTFEESAEDALAMKGFSKVKDWSVERVCFEAERYNGTGYQDKGDRSPYLWAGTNQQIAGKYTRDRYFDPGHWDIQPGVCAVLKILLEREPNLLGTDPIEEEAIAAPKAGYSPETHPEAHALLKQEQPSYGFLGRILKALGLPATVGGAAVTGSSEAGLDAYAPFLNFFREHGFKIAALVVLAVVIFEGVQFIQRKKAMT